MASGSEQEESSEMFDDDNLTYDWDDCETLQIVRAFPISDYGTKSDDQSSTDDCLVPEPPSLSGIIDSTISDPQPRTISDVDENYIDDEMSSLSDVSDMKVSNAPPRYEYGKERMEKKGNIYDKLYNACLKGELTTVNDILKKVNTTLMQDADGQTPLYAACIGDHTEIIKLLVNFGYDVNHQDKEGKTPLHITFENHAPHLAQTLITQFAANTEIRDKQNWSPLHTAIDRGYSSYSRELSQRFLHEDVYTEVSWIQLHSACFEENKHHVQVLLDANTDININHASSTGYTPLHIATAKSNMDLVTLLLDQSVDVNYETIDHQTPLHIAVNKGADAIIQKLLAQKADPNLKDVCGNTSLHLAVQLKQGTKGRLVKLRPPLAPYHSCNTHTIRAFIEHGADVNAINNKSQTPLLFACVNGQNTFVKILLDAGADPSIADQYRDSCLHAAIHGQCSIDTIQEMLDHGVQVNAKNKDGATPLLLACSTAQVDAVKLLLKAKADPNIAYADGEACLHAAIAADCSKETIQEIIDHGAEVNTVNKRGRTALLLGFTIIITCYYNYMFLQTNGFSRSST